MSGQTLEDELVDQLLAREDVRRAIAQKAREAQAPPAEEKKTTAPAQAQRSTGRSPLVALFAFVIGLPFWLDGARYTRDGWIAFLNWLAVRFAIPLQVPALSWKAALGAMIATGIAYSYIEMGRQPFTVPPRRQVFHWVAWHINPSWQAWIVWAVLITSDIATTYAGIRQSRPDELVVLQSIGTTAVSAALYGLAITFVPDRLIRWGWRGLWGWAH